MTIRLTARAFYNLAIHGANKMPLINKKETPKPKTWAKMTKGEKANIIRTNTKMVLKDIERSPHEVLNELAIHFGVGIQS
tara:strand:+ start:1108 stop:1347 length:240 start_codon:yes stop_codon:yes gene_type:complete